MSTGLPSSFQVSDVVIVSVDTRGFDLATRLAGRGWKVVVVEVSGGELSADMTWADRLGPFTGWERESVEPLDAAGEPSRLEFAGLWLSGGLVFLGGRRADVGERHLRVAYGATVFSELQVGAFGSGTLQQQWLLALRRNVLAARLARRERYLDGSVWPDLPLEKPVKNVTRADAIAAARRENALKAGVRIVDGERIRSVPTSDQHIDRIDVELPNGTLTERTRSVLWMLSREESSQDSFVSRDPGFFSLDDVAPELPVESSLAWWRARFALKGLGEQHSSYLQRLPEIPPVCLAVGSVERPWSHDNLILLERVERTGSGRQETQVYDAWVRIPYWARADHVYRDEQRLLVQERLKNHFAACEFYWVTPSPIALTAPAIRLPFVIYSETVRLRKMSDGAVKTKRQPIQNLIFAGPEVWPAIGFWGLRMGEDQWVLKLEKLRRNWDPVARTFRRATEPPKEANP